jgi:hypothetical protein
MEIHGTVYSSPCGYAKIFNTYDSTSNLSLEAPISLEDPGFRLYFEREVNQWTSPFWIVKQCSPFLVR